MKMNLVAQKIYTRWSLETKLEVVHCVVNGIYLVEEAMDAYGIGSGLTIRKWVGQYAEKVKEFSLKTPGDIFTDTLIDEDILQKLLSGGLSSFVPVAFRSFFNFVKIESGKFSYHVYFDQIESDISRGVHKNRLVKNIGYLDQLLIVQRTLINGKLVFFHIQRIKWRDIDTKQIVFQKWNEMIPDIRDNESYSVFYL